MAMRIDGELRFVAAHEIPTREQELQNREDGRDDQEGCNLAIFVLMMKAESPMLM